MGYVRTAGMSTAKRRARRRTALVITSLLLGLLLIFAISVASIQGWITLPGGGGSSDEAATSSAPAPAAEVEPSEVVVNVYNSTDTAGLAGRAADALRARGFAVDTVSNDSSDVPDVAIIRHGADGAAEAQTLQKALPKGVVLEADDREDSSVDLVLGQKWEDLPTAEDSEETGDR